jgi:hypothetical protein
VEVVRHVKGPHYGSRVKPKLMLTGRLSGLAVGRPVTLEATGRELLLSVPNVLSAWKLRHALPVSLTPLFRAARRQGFLLRLCIGEKRKFTLTPKESLLWRFLAPTLT